MFYGNNLKPPILKGRQYDPGTVGRLFLFYILLTFRTTYNIKF